MKPLDVKDILDYAKILHAERAGLCTLSERRSFTLEVERDTIIFHPSSKGTALSHTPEYIEKVCDIFNEKGSLRTVDYVGETWHVSYMVALIASYFGRIAEGRQPFDHCQERDNQLG